MMTPTPTGNVPVDIAERCFTLQDGVFLSRVAEQTIRNWRFRGILTTIGDKDARNGRWHFSLIDLLHLAVMYDLCMSRGLDFGPARADTIAAMVVRAARENLAQPRERYRKNLNVICGWEEDGELFAAVTEIRRAGEYSPPVDERDGDEFSPLRRVILCIPAAAMLSDLIIRTEYLQQRNKRAEAPTHV
jgi:hypothetical protein